MSPAAAIAAELEDGRRRLISIIESWAADIRRGGRGGMVVYKGETLETASIRTAYGKVIGEIPNEATGILGDRGRGTALAVASEGSGFVWAGVEAVHASKRHRQEGGRDHTAALQVRR